MTVRTASAGALMIQIKRWEASRCIEQDQTSGQLAEGPVNLARGLTLFGPRQIPDESHRSSNNHNNDANGMARNAVIWKFSGKIRIPLSFLQTLRTLSPWLCVWAWLEELELGGGRPLPVGRALNCSS